MESDLLLEKLFEPDRWERAIEKGVIKDIDLTTLKELCSPYVRAQMYIAIRDGKYEIAPPHQAQIPKDNPGEFRTVYVNENVDRVLLSLINDMLFECFPEMVHNSCKSYQTGIGCGKVVQEVSRKIVETERNSEQMFMGWKSDLSKYFDSVPIEFIDRVFDEIEKRSTKSKVIDILRKYYHTDLCFDVDGNLIEHYQSLKQGCAVAAFLADAMLYHIDQMLSCLDGFYVRYSDDCLFIGKDYEVAMILMKEELEKMNMSLNPRKVEYLTSDRAFKFLGFSIKGKQISLSGSRIKKFQKGIEERTIKNRGVSYEKALHDINKFLYVGDGQYSWATSVLSVINVDSDTNELNKFVMDCLRAVITGKGKVGGLGYVQDGKRGMIARGKGKNVRSNRNNTKRLDGYMTIACMRNALLTNKSAYDCLVRQLA